MNKKIEVVYLSPVTLIDNSIELIKLISENDFININVIIVVSLSSPNHTIFKIKDLNIKKGLYDFSDIKNFIASADIFENYFKLCKSVKVMFYDTKLNFNLIYENYNLLKYVYSTKPDLIHFDDAAGRLSLLILMIFGKKLILNVHDPVPHSGEYSLLTILRNLTYKKISAFVTFSIYSKRLFKKELQNKKYYCRFKITSL